MSYPNEPPLPPFNQVDDLSECVGATIETAWSDGEQIAIRFADGRVFFAELRAQRYADGDELVMRASPDMNDRVKLGLMTQQDVDARQAAQADWDRRCREGRERTEYLALKAKFAARDGNKT